MDDVGGTVRMIGPICRLGELEVVALDDGVGPFFADRGAAFVDATDAQWARADAFDPGSVSRAGEWVLHFRCFAIREPSGRVILVDAGIGPADAPAASWTPVPGRLPQALAMAGIERGAVDTVVLTHVHTDHIGWAVTGGEPYFGNARHVVQAVEVAALEEGRSPLVDRLLAPLRRTGQLDVVAGDVALTASVGVVATPGHTPGHQSVLVRAEGERMLISGDVLVHAIQLLHPEIGYAYEADQEAARQTRQRLLDDLSADGGRIATAHLTEPFLRLPARAGE